MDNKIYNGVIEVDQWGDSHVFSVSRAVNIDSVISNDINIDNAFPLPKPPVPYFYVMPTSQTGLLKVRLLNSQPDEYLTLSNEVLTANIGVFMPIKIVEIHKDSTLSSFIIAI